MPNSSQLNRAHNARAFDVLDFYRFVGAVGVALAHYTIYFPLERETRSAIFNALHPLMGFFFTLSGFVIMHMYDGQITSFSRYGDYIRKRLARIYPMFLLTFSIVFLHAVYTNNSSDMFASSAVLPNLLLLHAWNTTSMLTFDYPSWSVSAEWFVYLLFPAFLVMVNRMRGFAFALPFALGLAVAGVFSVFGLGNWVDATFNGGCLMAAPCFVGGMVLHRLLTRRLPDFRAPVWLAHAMAVATIALILTGAPGSLVLVYMGALVFVMAAARPDRPGVLSRPFARRLANASYGFYLLHVPVANILLRSLVHRLEWPPAAAYALAPGAIVVTTVLSIATFQYFERPLRRYLSAPLPRAFSLRSLLNMDKQPVRDAQ